MSISEDLSSFSESPSGQPQVARADNGDLSVGDLGGRLTKLLSIQCEQKSTCASIPSPDNDDAGDAFKEDDINNIPETELGNFTSEKCSRKCATLSCSPKGKGMLSDDKGTAGPNNDLAADNLASTALVQSANCPYSHSISVPTPLKLVSAIKGSREKLGAPPRKLTVKWAPDVYDPTPTAVSHVPNNKPQRHRSDRKKNGKNKQKGGGKGSRGTKGKDKKQSPKYSGNSSRSLKSLDNEGKVACSIGRQASTVDFDVANPDPFCGHSFLRKSVTQMHFSVAEAT